MTDPFEPGSTFKVILAAAALEEGVVRPTDRFYGENGAITIASATIHDWKKYGWLTFTEVLQNSSNVGSIKVGLSLGKERYYKYITGFGFGTPTGAGPARREPRPAPRAGPLVRPLARHHVDRAGDLGDGAADGLRLRRGGQRRTPHAAADRARDCWTGKGARCRASSPRSIRQVISPETARTLTGIMTRVVSDGTGHNAAIAGFEVAGKTGTAQKLDPATRRYSRAPGVLSFVGFAPADDPRSPCS